MALAFKSDAADRHTMQVFEDLQIIRQGSKKIVIRVNEWVYDRFCTRLGSIFKPFRTRWRFAGDTLLVDYWDAWINPQYYSEITCNWWRS